ncbi:MAG TPA: 50S ribosomal protein L11 methyltransferase [Syntrophomonas sp.]|nr:50S ribosomal protein L11 methyltransferase [Syntrophomonas sp.]
MNWKEYTVITEGQCVEAIADIFQSLDAGGVSIEAMRPEIGQIMEADEPMPAPYGQYDQVLIKAYFPQERDVAKELQEALELVQESFQVCCRLLLGQVQESDWEESWKKYYHCFKIGQRLVVKPSWEEYMPQPGEVIIELDPGMAFGTGDHASTRFCLEFIDDYVKGGENIIDAGCGSGILSIAAAKLGAARVLAMDIDQVAVNIARANVSMNGLDKIVQVECGDITRDLSSFKADYIFANITAEVVVQLIPRAAELLPAGAYLFCSGIIASRWPQVRQQLEKYGFEIARILQDQEWMGIAAHRR